MGLLPSKPDYRRTLDEGTSNSSLANVRYVEIKKPKWKVFHTKEIHAVPFNTGRGFLKTCNCGQEGMCKQKFTPCGVAMHYPQKKWKNRLGNLPNLNGKKETNQCSFPSPAMDTFIPMKKRNASLKYLNGKKETNQSPMDNLMPKKHNRTVKDISLSGDDPEQPEIIDVQTGETNLAVQVQRGRHSLTLLIDISKAPNQDGKLSKKLPNWRVEDMECNGKKYKVSTDDQIAASKVKKKKKKKKEEKEESADDDNSPDTEDKK